MIFKNQNFVVPVTKHIRPKLEALYIKRKVNIKFIYKPVIFSRTVQINARKSHFVGLRSTCEQQHSKCEEEIFCYSKLYFSYIPVNKNLVEYKFYIYCIIY